MPILSCIAPNPIALMLLKAASIIAAIFLCLFSFFHFQSLWSFFLHKNLEGENIWPRWMNRQGVVCSTWNLVWPKVPFPLLQTDSFLTKENIIIWAALSVFNIFNMSNIFYTDDKKAIVLIQFYRRLEVFNYVSATTLNKEIMVVMIRK